jgi:Calcineurin-like phosphoesterase/Purple acid Phosphatase, N-terminal domain
VVFRSFFLLIAVFNTFAGVKVCDGGEFRVLPYLQNPQPTSMTVRWFSNSDSPAALTVRINGEDKVYPSVGEQSQSLIYNPFKEEPGGPHPGVPWRHTVRIDGLLPGTTYNYAVRQAMDVHEAQFSTSPDSNTPVRLIVYSDSETEPESSTVAPVAWTPSTGSNRPPGLETYPVNQTVGYQQNCRMIADRNPGLLMIVGDIVECGGEQRDWDEFWRHNAGEWNSLATRVPIIPAIGNHENYAGPGGAYTTPAANFSTDKYLTYFETPDNEASNPKHRGRYYRLDYGPVTIICLDSSDGKPHQTAADTNFNLDGSNAPDFSPGSEQYRWMEEQLKDCQLKARFTIVQFHHTMFGSGPHSVPFGHPNFSGQAGIPMRVLLPSFLKYGVDVVFSGHDEMLERSQVDGSEQLPDGTSRTHSIHLYDVGMGGDGLRGPSEGFDNPYRKFLCHHDVPEKWDGHKLVSGGKHYGHLEVNVKPIAEGQWQMVIEPVHAFPLMDETGMVTNWERRIYPDTVILNSK